MSNSSHSPRYYGCRRRRLTFGPVRPRGMVGGARLPVVGGVRSAGRADPLPSLLGWRVIFNYLRKDTQKERERVSDIKDTSLQACFDPLLMAYTCVPRSKGCIV